jgi:hypothetical protein
VLPTDNSCRERAEAPDGGGEDTECNCTRDYCYDEVSPTDGITRRFCQKQQ